MSEQLIDKETTLKNILLKTFQNSLIKLEKRTKEQINNLSMTSKQFKQFNKTINDLIINVNITREKKLKSKEKNLSIKKRNLIRSKTENNFFPNNKHSLKISSKNIKTNIKRIFFPKHKQRAKTLNKSFENMYNQKYSKNKNNKSKSLLNKNQNKDNKIRKNFNPSNSMINIKSRSMKSYKKAIEIKADLYDIQEQIKKVENTINNTEKLVHKKSVSGSEIIKLKKKPKTLIINHNIKPFFEKMNNKIKDYIFSFCNKIDSFNLIKSNKRFFNQNHINFLQNLLNNLNEENTIKEMNEIKENNKEEIEKEYPEFHLTRGAIKAIELLNDELYNKIFKIDELSGKLCEILNIYKLLCQLLKKDDLLKINDKNKFWNEICFWLYNDKRELGNFLYEKSKEFVFDDENIDKIEKMIKSYKNTIYPSYYSKICGTTGLIVFILKDALEYAGIFYNEKKTPIKRVFHNLEKQMNKIAKLKEFIERLKVNYEDNNKNDNSQNIKKENIIENKKEKENKINNEINDNIDIYNNNNINKKKEDKIEKNDLISISIEDKVE